MSSLGAGERLIESLPMAEVRPRPAFRLWDYARQLIGTGLFFLGALSVSFALWPFGLLARRLGRETEGQRVLHHAFRGYLGVLKRLGCLELDVRGMELLKNVEGTIIASNHPGLLDAFFLVALQPRTACVMRAGLMRNPLLRGGALGGGYVTNDSGPALVRQGIEKIRSGGNLLIFPEGTRTRTQAVNRFKSGFALISVATGAPVQTVLIERQGTHLAKGAGLFTPTPMPIRIRIRPGLRFVPAPGESAREFTRRLEDWFRSQLINNGGEISARPPGSP